MSDLVGISKTVFLVMVTPPSLTWLILLHYRQSSADDETEMMEPLSSEPWTPSPYTVFKIIMSARLCAAAWNIVGDCDETYNYWEPVCTLEHKHGKTKFTSFINS